LEESCREKRGMAMYLLCYMGLFLPMLGALVNRSR
jgi:hypothetical protein